GRNGAGKSTLLRQAAGLERPTRGRIRSAGRVALLLQHPGDYLLHERVGEECSPEALRAVGLEASADRNPRDLSGGERQGRVIADGPIEQVLSGGWYFATETARVLGGAGGALTPDQGAELLRVRASVRAAS